MTAFSPRRQEVYDAIKEYVAFALKVIREDGSPMPSIYRNEWVRYDENTFRQNSVISPLLAVRLGNQELTLQDSPEYKRCMKLLKEDQIIGPQLDTLVGGNSRTRITVDTVIDEMLTRLITDGDMEFDAIKFDQLYQPIEAFFLEPEVRVTLLMPLGGFDARRPLALGDDLRIDPISDEEISTLLNMGVLTPLSGAFSVAAFLPKYGVRVMDRIPKVVGGAPGLPADLEEAGKRQQRMYEHANEVVDALRLFKPERVVPAGTILFESGPFQGRGGMFQRLTADIWIHGNYVLNELETAEFPRLWQVLHSAGVTRTKYLNTAFRRLSFKTERRSAEDQIIDLMIAAEALFLSGSGDETTRGEQRYRLSLRAASFVASERWSPLDVFKLMKLAYDTRSKVVHGGAPGMMRFPDGAEANIGQLVEAIDGLLRQAILKTVRLASAGMGALNVDWEASILKPNQIETEPAG